MPVLQVITASTRPGRVGPAVAAWFAEQARSHGGFDVEVVDLAEVGLPLLDEPNHPRLRQYTHDHTRAWSASVLRADAFVFVHPEYNYGINAALKNALDFVFAEWHYAPVGSVSYGGVSGGLRAQQMLKQILPALKLMVTQDAVIIPFVREFLKDGRFEANAMLTDSAAALLDELARLTTQLASMRAEMRAGLAESTPA